MSDKIQIKDLDSEVVTDNDYVIFQKATDPYTVYKTTKSALKGDTGDPATVDIGSTVTLAPGSLATAENVGTIYNAIINFGIPEGEKGDDGDTGPIGMSWQGAYNALTAYSINDGVSYLGSSYICIQAATGQTPSSPGNLYWDLIAKKGEDGGSGDGDFLADGTIPMTGNLNLAGNKLIGGTDTTSDLYIQTTTGEGTTGADMHFLVGNNGGTEALTILNDGKIGIGTNAPGELLQINGHAFINGTNGYIYGNNKLSYINMYNDVTGGIDIHNLNGTAATRIFGALTVDGALSFGGNLSLGNGSYITSGPGQVASIVLYDGSTGNLIFKAATTSAAISRMRWYTGTTSAERMRLDEIGNLGIGTTSPTAVLHLKAGTATANTAPLKFTSGTNLTTAEAGAMEWNGTNLFVTQTSGPTRKTLAYTTDITERVVEVNTAVEASPKVLTSADSGKIFTNTGASAANWYTLPSAVAGLQYTFYVQDSDGIHVAAATGDTISILDVTSESGGFIEGSNVGISITLVAIDSTRWVGISGVNENSWAVI